MFLFLFLPNIGNSSGRCSKCILSYPSLLSNAAALGKLLLGEVQQPFETPHDFEGRTACYAAAGKTLSKLNFI